MKNNITFCLLVFCLDSLNLISAQGAYAQERKHHFALYLGAGPNYYFNNLAIGKDLIRPLNYSLVGRLMWEPGRIITLGIESGYSQMYTATYSTSLSTSAHISKIAIPIQLVSSIKILKNYYANFSIGQTCIQSRVSGPSTGNSKSSSWSLADFSLGGGYRYTFKSRISLAAEARFFYSTKYSDGNIAILFMAGYKF
ncbi:MAG: outer membrane beta-barrel protein [Chitinophagales bacterium]